MYIYTVVLQALQNINLSALYDQIVAIIPHIAALLNSQLLESWLGVTDTITQASLIQPQPIGKYGMISPLTYRLFQQCISLYAVNIYVAVYTFPCIGHQCVIISPAYYLSTTTPSKYPHLTGQWSMSQTTFPMLVVREILFPLLYKKSLYIGNTVYI